MVIDRKTIFNTVCKTHSWPSRCVTYSNKTKKECAIEQMFFGQQQVVKTPFFNEVRRINFGPINEIFEHRASYHVKAEEFINVFFTIDENVV